MPSTTSILPTVLWLQLWQIKGKHTLHYINLYPVIPSSSTPNNNIIIHSCFTMSIITQFLFSIFHKDWKQQTFKKKCYVTIKIHDILFSKFLILFITFISMCLLVCIQRKVCTMQVQVINLCHCKIVGTSKYIVFILYNSRPSPNKRLPIILLSYRP